MLTRLGAYGLAATLMASTVFACDEHKINIAKAGEGHTAVIARVLTNQIEEGEKAFFGIQLGEDEDGIAILKVIDGGPADQAGFVNGDIIVRMGDTSIEGVGQFVETVKDFEPGDDVTVEYIRDGDGRTRTITLGRRADRPEVFSGALSFDMNEDAGNFQWHTPQMHDFVFDAMDNMKVEIQCEDGKGTKTIERDGKVETFEFECDENNHKGMFFGGNEGVYSFVMPQIEGDIAEKLKDMQIDLGDLDVKLHSMAPAIRHRTFLGRDRAPRVSFRENTAGQIEVVIRKGDAELVKQFDDPDDMADRAPDLYEKYSELNE
jgi:hypothetical protein